MKLIVLLALLVGINVYTLWQLDLLRHLIAVDHVKSPADLYSYPFCFNAPLNLWTSVQQAWDILLMLNFLTVITVIVVAMKIGEELTEE